MSDRETISALQGEIDAGRIHLLNNYNNRGARISLHSNGVATGQNSGYQAINIAVLAGATRIILLGYDMQHAADGRQHWFGDHPVKERAGVFSAFLHNFRKAAPVLAKLGVEVINCSPGSALDCFKHEKIESVLADSIAAALP